VSVARIDQHTWHLFHRLWTKAAGAPEYVKAEWHEFEGLLASCPGPENARKLQEGEELRRENEYLKRQLGIAIVRALQQDNEWAKELAPHLAFREGRPFFVVTKSEGA
jgi:hypothetical protein